MTIYTYSKICNLFMIVSLVTRRKADVFQYKTFRFPLENDTLSTGKHDIL